MIRAILLDVLGPIVLMVICGAIMQWKFKIDLGTLSKLNLYLLVPAFVFDKVSTSTLSFADMGGVVTITFVQVATLGILIYWIGRIFRISRKTLAAVALAVMFYNSGNYGLPLAELAYPKNGPAYASVAEGAFRKDGGAVQAFVLMSQNILTYTLGLSIAAFAGSGSFFDGIKRIARLPMLPVLAAALLSKMWLQGDASRHLPIFISNTAGYLSAALVPVALVTLGAQLATNPRWPRWKPVSLVLLLRLIFGPVQMALLLWGFHRVGWRATDLWPWPAELLILTAATPSAVSTLILTLELDGDADLAADCVFWTTILSCVTITGWLVALRLFFQ